MVQKASPPLAARPRGPAAGCGGLQRCRLSATGEVLVPPLALPPNSAHPPATNTSSSPTSLAHPPQQQRQQIGSFRCHSSASSTWNGSRSRQSRRKPTHPPERVPLCARWRYHGCSSAAGTAFPLISRYLAHSPVTHKALWCLIGCRSSTAGPSRPRIGACARCAVRERRRRGEARVPPPSGGYGQRALGLPLRRLASQPPGVAAGGAAGAARGEGPRRPVCLCPRCQSRLGTCWWGGGRHGGGRP